MKYFLSIASESLQQAIADYLQVSDELVQVEAANEKIGSHLAAPIFRFAKQAGKTPPELATAIADYLNEQLANNSFAKDNPLVGVDRFEGINGFVNAWFTPQTLMRGFFADVLRQQHKNLRYGDTTVFAEQHIGVEHTDPNPFKELHIGHLYVNTVGESIARLYEVSGAKVTRISYHGDVGMHVAKAMYGIRAELADRGIAMSEVPYDEQSNFLGKAYARGAAAFEADEATQEEIKELNKAVYAMEDPDLKAQYDLGFTWSFEYFDRAYRRLGTRFNRRYLESQSAIIGRKLVQDNIANGIFTESDGAVIYKGDERGLHTRVFMNDKGLPTYEAKDLGLAVLKAEDEDYDLSLIITAEEQATYFKVVLDALSQLKPELAKKTEHMWHGVVKLSTGKMSSRTGDVVTAMSMIDAVEAAITERSPESPSIRENSLAAIKYALLSHSLGGDIVYDLEESISLEGNSGPYIQYAAVRIISLLAKNPVEGKPAMDYDWQAESDLLWHAVQYPLVVETAAQKRAPHLIANYLFELAKLNNQYYETVSIKDSAEPEKTARVGLLKAVLNIYQHGLFTLGIDVPAKM